METVYSTKRLVVHFSCVSNRLYCIIYRKGQRVDNFTRLQSHTMNRPNFSRLSDKQKLVACRSVLKAMRKNMSNSLRVTLENGTI